MSFTYAVPGEALNFPGRSGCVERYREMKRKERKGLKAERFYCVCGV
jgi:hypothetical protein